MVHHLTVGQYVWRIHEEQSHSGVLYRSLPWTMIVFIAVLPGIFGISLFQPFVEGRRTEDTVVNSQADSLHRLLYQHYTQEIEVGGLVY